MKHQFISNKTWRGFVGLLLFGLVIAWPLSAAGRERLCMMTFNVPKGNIKAEGLNTWEGRCKAIQQFLDTVKPDVLGMQEIVRTEAVDLLKGMPNYSMIGVARDNGIESGEYTPILYHTKHILCEANGTFWLSKTPDKVSKNWASACYRICTWGLFLDKRTGARFIYFNTHLDHISDSARYNQMAVLKTQMLAIRQKYGNLPCMLTGDFNVKASNRTYNEGCTYKVKMKDAWLTAGKTFGPAVTFRGGRNKIDHMLITTEVTSDSSFVHDSYYPNGQILSDHNAHYSILSWNETLASRARMLRQEAQAAYDSLVVHADRSVALITNCDDGSAACQASCDKLNTTEGQYYKYLIDGNTSTYLHTQDKSPLPPNQPHYLQFDLRRTDVSAFTFKYHRRVSDSYGVADRWQDVIISASNDANSWKYITELYDFGGDADQDYYSPLIDLHKAYRYVRFSVMHTPAMKLRNANPQFTVSEFQMYLNAVDKSASQLYYDADVNAAALELQTAMDVVETAGEDVTQEQYDALATALAGLRRVKIKGDDLSAQIADALNLLSTYTVGDQMGQTSAADSTALQNVIDRYKPLVGQTLSREEADSALNAVKTATDAFLSSRHSFETGRWYYIANNGGRVKGHVLAEVSNNSADPVCHTEPDAHNPYSMWRIVAVDEAAGTYSLQNRATGFYLGLINDTAYVSSVSPEAYKVSLCGVNNFHLQPASTNYISYVTAGTGRYLVAAYGGAGSTSAWALTPVAADDELGTVKIPVTADCAQFVCLPFAVDDIKALNHDIETYTLNSSPATTTFCFQKKSSFAAGEPFLLVVGDASQFDAAKKQTAYLSVLPPNDFTLEPLHENGFYGVLDHISLSKISYFFVDNALKRRTNQLSSLDGHTAYLVRGEITATGAPIDATVKANGTVVTGIHAVTAPASATDVYSTDGRLVLQGATPGEIDRLPRGIYIVGKDKKVLK